MPTDYAALLRGAPAETNYAALLRQAPAPSLAQAVNARDPSGIDDAARQVADEMGMGERALVGAGRGLTLAGRGLKQLGLEAATALGFDAQGSLASLADRETEEKRIFDAGAGQTGAGMAGAIVGEALPYLAVPGGAVGRGLSLAQKALAGAGLGAAVGAAQYVDPDETRLGNIAQGAALGGMASGVLDVAAKGGAKVGNAIAGRLTPVADEVTALGQKFDVPVYAPDVAGSPIMNKVATLAEDIPLVGMAKPRLRQADAAGEAAGALIGRLAPQVDDVGRALQSSLTRRTETLQKLAGRRYDRVAQAADPLGAVPLSNLRATAQRLADEAKKDIDPNATLISRLERIAQAPDAPAFTQARQFRSTLGDSIRQLESGMDLKAARPLQAIKGALEQDMNQFAANAGGDVAKKWRAADQFFREKVIPQRESDLVKAMRNRNPDEVFRQFVKAGAQDRAQRLYTALDSKGRGAVKAGILNQALERATQSGAKGVTFSPSRFAGEMEKMQGAAGVFFKGADKREIDGFTKLMRHVERAGQVAENPPTGNRLVLPVLMGETLAPGTTAATLGTGGLSRLLFTTEAGKRLLLASNRFPPGSARMERAISRFREKAPALIAGQEGGL